MLMTEQQIASAVERKVDALDKRYLSTSMTEAEYKAELRAIDRWAEHHWAVIRALFRA